MSRLTGRESAGRISVRVVSSPTPNEDQTSVSPDGASSMKRGSSPVGGSLQCGNGPVSLLPKEIVGCSSVSDSFEAPKDTVPNSSPKSVP